MSSDKLYSENHIAIDSTARTPHSQRLNEDMESRAAAEHGAKVSVTIDSHTMEVPIRTTVLDAAKKVNVRIPTLCFHPDLCIAGVCRICVVEIEGQRTLRKTRIRRSDETH